MKPTNILVALLIALGMMACDKPSEDSCRQAIENMQKLIGSENLTTDIEGQVRRCRGGSSKKSVECAIAAKTVEQLHACEFTKGKPAAGSAK